MDAEVSDGIIPGLEPDEEAKLLPRRPVLVGYRGSIAHGMYVSPEQSTGIDDKDIHCVYIPGIEHYFGLGSSGNGHSRGRDIKVREWDCAAYELRKFGFLLSQCNPNVLTLLWQDPSRLLFVGLEGARLISNRRLFSSRLAYNTFCGYAHAQLKRMTAYRDSGEESCCDGEEFHAIDCELKRERGRGSGKKFATGFMGKKRKALVKEHGYDTKNAAHCVRLLRMGAEFLLTGEVAVDRSVVGDAKELLAIKRGEWSADQARKEAARAFDSLKAARDKSVLPAQPDIEGIERLLVALLSGAFIHAAMASCVRP